MNKTELILSIAEATGLSRKDIELGLNAAVEQITQALIAGEKVQIVGFGCFETKLRAARTGRNPRSGQQVPIPSALVPVFKPGKALKEAVEMSGPL